MADHLAEASVFIIEAFVPDQIRFVRGQNVEAGSVETDQVDVHVARHDPVRQQVAGQHLYSTEGGVRMYPHPAMVCLDLGAGPMTRLVGMRLYERWGDWRRGCPFTPSSTSHVSVYKRAL